MLFNQKKTNALIWGFCQMGWELFKLIMDEYSTIRWADNSVYKIGCFVNQEKILSLQEVEGLVQNDWDVFIASSRWVEIVLQLNTIGIKPKGYYINHEIREYSSVSFADICFDCDIRLYAGDICDDIHLEEKNLYGLSINKMDSKHIFHDITEPYPIPDKSISNYEAEDVFEHIPYSLLPQTINEIYRILKPGGVLRISVPDYNSPVLKRIVMTDDMGRRLYDPNGGGSFGSGGVSSGGHMWFPTYGIMRELLQTTLFEKEKFLCYWDNDSLIRRHIDMEYGYLNRVNDMVPDEDIANIVVDCYRE